MRTPLVLAMLVAGCGSPGKPVATTPTPAPIHTKLEAAPVAAAPASPAVRVREVEGITEYRLGNGLQVLLFPDDTQSTVTVDVTYAVGSRHEGYGETGMAHLIEHMMFKGTKRLREIAKLLDAHGAESNASTDYDRTEYHETLPATQDNLDWTLEMEADRMVSSTFLDSDLASEFSVVRNEFESGENNPQAILWERVMSTAYLWHNYGKSVIGSRSDIERVKAPTLRAFYAKYYQPDNATLIVAGKLDVARTLATIDHTFGAIPRPARALPATYSVEPVQDGEREVTLRRTGDVSLVALGYHGVAGTSADAPALEAALAILDREPAGRLYEKLVETKLAASVDTTAQALHDPGEPVVMAEVRDPQNLAKVEAIMRAEIEGLGASKIADKEVERWRAATLKNLELTMTDSRHLALLLPEYIALGDWRTLFAYRDRVQKVTAADVARVAKTYFVASNRTTGRFVPTKDPARAPLTEAPELASVVAGIEEGKGIAEGEKFDATPDTLEARTKRVELAGGIKAALLPKKTRGGKVTLALQLHFGDEASLQGKRAAADMMGALLGRGTAKKSYQDIRDLEDQLRARIAVTASADGLSVQIETLRDKLPAALDLAAEIATQPSFPAKELEVVRQEELAQLEEQLQDPESLAGVVARQVAQPWPKRDPRYAATPAEQLAEVKAVTLAEVKDFYAKFVGNGHGELAVVGDFDDAAIAVRVGKLFGAAAWKSKAPYARLTGKAFSVAGTTKTVDTPDKENAMLVVSQDVAMRDTDADYPAWLVVGQVFGGDNASRVWQRLREKGGLSYGAYGWTTASALDEVGAVTAEAIVAPANAAKARTALVEEIGKLATGAFTKDEVETAKTAMLKLEVTEWAKDSAVTGMLLAQLYEGRTFAEVTARRAKVGAVTVDDVARVARKWVHPERLVVVEVGDQAKAKTK